MTDMALFEYLTTIRTSKYYGLCMGQLQALLTYGEALKYFTELAKQNDQNKSKLCNISEISSS